jgi:hypothetical protein
MKDTKSSQVKGKRSAEDWVDIARVFGEKCLDIQHNSKLSLEQKLEKQRVLSEEMAKEIQNDPHLQNEDKTTMINSIKNYMDDWTKIHETLQSSSNSETEKKKSKK